VQLVEDELEKALATWPANRLPELHYSEQAEGKTRGAHADWITGKGLLRFLEEVDGATDRECVVVIEAKKKDLAIARAVAELRGRQRTRLFELVPRLAEADEAIRELAKLAA
jgi:UV DNA damage endonuclease